MCVVALTYNTHPDWPLLLIGNRDEFHARPTAPLARWGGARESGHHIIAGRDLESGGSWLGVSEQGRVAVVTNIRSDTPPAPDKSSRGALVADYLAGAGKYKKLKKNQIGELNPFHLFTLDSAGSALHSANLPEPKQRKVGNGILGLSNAEADADWPRKDRLEAQLAHWLAHDARNFDALFDQLRSEERGESESLPNFLDGDIYGTRCSTIIAVNPSGQGRIIERRFGVNGQGAGDSEFVFDWPSGRSKKGAE